MKKRLASLTFCMLFVQPLFLFSQDQKSKNHSKKKYTLTDCLVKALQLNAQIKIARLDNKIAKIVHQASDAKFEWNLSSTAAWDDSTETTSGSLGVSKFFSTGTTIGISTNSSDTTGENDVTNSLSFQLTQALLEGFNRQSNLFSVYQSKIKLSKAKYQLKQIILSTVFKTSRAYFLYLRALKTDLVILNALNQARKFLKQVQDLEKAGVRTKLDIGTAAVEVAKREEEKLRSQKNIKNSLDQIKREIGLDMDLPFELDDQYNINKDIKELSKIKAYYFAFNNRPDFIIRILDIEFQKRNINKSKKDKLPNLDLTYSVTSTGVDDHYFPAWKADSHPNHSIFLEFSMPLFRKSKKKEYAVQQQNLRKFEIIKWEDEQEIKLQVRRVLRNLAEARKRIEVQKKKVAIERKRKESFDKKFELGTIDSLEVTRANDALSNAEIDLINSKLDLQILISEYYFIIGGDVILKKVPLQDKKEKGRQE